MNENTLLELLRETGQGDLQSFEKLYGLSAPKLFSLCRQLMQSDALAEEILQESFVQIWREAHRYDQRRASAFTWMATIARHKAIDELRRRAREHRGRESLAAQPSPQLPGLLDTLLDDAQTRALDRCLNQLSARQKETIVLAFFRGLTHSELAKSLSAPVGSIKSWIRRGMEQLKLCLQK
ncbi:MAG: sigma-70 family RNA polymerase sigma factor [Gammaproteobacteria bacterium]|nr:sigma-70 family RNA polymerase sigma factor [Gammaproteobacteria bacterium]